MNRAHPETLKTFLRLSVPLHLCVSCARIPQRRNFEASSYLFSESQTVNLFQLNNGHGALVAFFFVL